MKKKDVTILAHLRKHGRIALTELSRKTGLPVSTIFDRIKSYQDNEISKHTPLLRFPKLGFHTTAHILLKVDAAHKQDLVKSLMSCPNINSLYKVNNGWDVLCECVFSNMCALEEFVESLQIKHHVIAKEIHYVLNELKREGFLSDPDTARFVFDNTHTNFK